MPRRMKPLRGYILARTDSTSPGGIHIPDSAKPNELICVEVGPPRIEGGHAIECGLKPGDVFIVDARPPRELIAHGGDEFKGCALVRQDAVVAVLGVDKRET